MGDPTCSAAECHGKVVARGLCGKHYQRMAKLGDLAGLPLTACAYCGEQFRPRRRDQQYCSRPCKVTAATSRRPKPPLRGESACRFCGTPFTEQDRRRDRIHCGQDECRRAYHRALHGARRERELATRPQQQCAECGSSFTAVHPNRRYCSPGCKRTALLRQRRDREYQPPKRQCAHCSAEIPYKSGKRRFCSSECQLAAAAKIARWRVKGLWPDHGMPEICGLCGTDQRLDIDHDHLCCPGERSCGKCVRGFLCRPHNVGLGMFGEDPAQLRAAAEYIERHREALII